MTNVNLDEILAKAALFDEMYPALQELLTAVCYVRIERKPASEFESQHYFIISELPGTKGKHLYHSHSFTACIEWLTAQRFFKPSE